MAPSPPASWCYLVVLAVLAAVLLPLLHPIHRPFTSSPRIFPRTDTDPSRASGRISFTIRPRSMTTTLPARRATAGVWETISRIHPITSALSPHPIDASRPAPGRINMFAIERLVQPVEVASSS